MPDAATDHDVAPDVAPVESLEYVVPLIHARIPASIGSGAFWAVVGIALAEVIDPPLAIALAAGFLVAGRRRRVAGTV